MNESLIGRSVAELRAAVREADRAETRARMRKLALFAELDRRGIFDQRGPESIGLRGLVDLIQLDLNCTRSQAKALVTEVERFAGRISVTGEPLEPIYSVMAEALSAGQLTFAHAAVIGDVIDKLPAEVRTEHAVAVERKLVILAAEHDPKALRTLADRIVALLDPDGPEPTDDVQHRHRRLRLLINPDGSGTIDGQLTATAVAVWQVVLGSLAAQRNTRRDEDGNPVACTNELGPGELGPGELGPDELGPDTRTLWQRHHDAFEQAGRRLLKTGTLPDHAGLPAQLVITIDLRDLESRAGRATTHHGGTLTVQQALQLAAEATVIPVILDQQLGLLQHGRGKRLASPIQRKILFARDRGCTFPGCAKPAAESEVHHLRDWLKFGPTDPDNLTITCGYHNNEAPRQGWTARLSQGVPYWTPPKWRDPEQKPRRNWVHHPELLRPDQ